MNGSNLLIYIGTGLIKTAFDVVLSRLSPIMKVFARFVPLTGQRDAFPTIRAVFVVRYGYVSPKGEPLCLFFLGESTVSCGSQFEVVLKTCLDFCSNPLKCQLKKPQLCLPMKNLDLKNRRSCKPGCVDCCYVSPWTRKLG